MHRVFVCFSRMFDLGQFDSLASEISPCLMDKMMSPVQLSADTSQRILAFVILMTLSVMATHGFGLWLFSALLPRMKESLELGYDQVALITASVPFTYMLFCLLSSLLIPLLGSARVTLLSVAGSGLCMLAVVGSTQVWQVALLLILISSCAGLHWMSMVELASRVVPVHSRNRALGLIAGGSAVGICVNGVLISPLFNGWVWQELWLLGAAITLILASALWGLFFSNPGLTGSLTAAVVPAGRLKESVSVWDALKLCFSHRVARTACLLSALIGIMTAPYMTYLNVYLSDELGYASVLVSTTWNLAGLGGLFGGIGLGWLADRRGGAVAIRFSLLLFLAGAFILAFEPRAWLVPLAGITYGVMYFPFWGLIVGKFSRFFEPRVSLHLVSLSLVSFSSFAAAGNWVGGYLYQLTGSLTVLYGMIVGVALVTLLLSLTLPKAEKAEDHHDNHRL